MKDKIQNIEKFLHCFVHVEYGEIATRGRVDCLFISPDLTTKSIIVRIFNEYYGLLESVIINLDTIKNIELDEYLEETFKRN